MTRVPEEDIEAQANLANPSEPLQDRRYKSWLLKAQENQRSICMKLLKHGTKSEIAQNGHKIFFDTSIASSKQTKLELRLQAIETLFGLSGEHVQQWPGIFDLCSHLEQHFGSLVSTEFDVIWKILNRPKPNDPVEGWHWCFAVIEAFQSLQNNDNVSIENAYQHLVAGSPRTTVTYNSYEKDHALQAIFAVLCCATMTLKPVLGVDHCNLRDSVLQPCFRAEGLLQTVSLQDAKRPVNKIFRRFRNQLDDFEVEPAVTSMVNTDILYESSVNFSSLYTVGRIRLKWVDTLTSHLDFDRQTRTLSILRLPTFCASSILRKQEIGVLQQIIAGLLPSRYYADAVNQDPASLYRELLLSYRLLFGQSSKSRQLLKNLLAQLKKSSEEMDPFLSTLCTTPLSQNYFFIRHSKPKLPPELFPSSNLNVNNILMECDSYSARDDFPIFGPRLLALQSYNLRQQPSRVRDLWRDRRNPLQWYTFWAVLLIGGITLIIGLLQLILSVGQLYVAIRPPK